MGTIQYRIQPDTLVLTNAITTPHGDVYVTYEEDSEADDQRPYYEVEAHSIQDQWLSFESGLERVDTTVYFHAEDTLVVTNESGTAFRVSLDTVNAVSDRTLAFETEVTLTSGVIRRGASNWYQIENDEPVVQVTNEDGTTLRISTAEEDEDDVELSKEDELLVTGASTTVEDVVWWSVDYDDGENVTSGFVNEADISEVFLVGFVNGADIGVEE